MKIHSDTKLKRIYFWTLYIPMLALRILGTIIIYITDAVMLLSFTQAWKVVTRYW